MKRIFISLLVCLFTDIVSASVELGGINYNLDTSTYTATIVDTDFSGDLIIPGSINVDGVDYEVTEIDNKAFQGSSNLTSVKIPKTIKSIGALAFANGKGINIYISDLSSWCSINFGYARSIYGGDKQYEPIAQYRLFLNNVEVTNLEIPSDITSIKKNAFSGCISISILSIHDDIILIDDYAFYKCVNLKTVEFGKNVRTIGDFCFCHCSSIEKLSLPHSLQTLCIGALQSLDKLTELTIPGNVKTIESGCFLNDTNLSSIIFEDSDKNIFIGSGQYSKDPMFMDCPLQKVYIGRDLMSAMVISDKGYITSPFKNQTGLISVTIGEGVKILGSNLFEGCSSLTTINTPNSLEEVGYGIFEGCVSLPIINNIRYADRCAISVIDKDADNFVLSSDTRLISHYCFSDCKKLTTITLPDDLVFWGDKVFSGCSALSMITIPKNVKTIGKYAFEECKSLKEIVIPENIIGIYDDAFNGCESLVKIKFEDSKNNIRIGTSGYSHLSIFIDCPLEEVYIGREVSMYDVYSNPYYYLPFYKKETIKTLTIGSEVKKIWNYSFYGCSALENIFALRDKPIALDSETFSNSIYSTCKLNVLPNSISLYSSAKVWRNFQNILGIATSIEASQHQSINEEMIYDMNGILGNKTPGLKIIKARDGRVRKVLIK